ncbi:MAG: ATP-binding cassette domain-containing protein [Clostridia bacterium]|nr:ATP-binding cassette domain-containing protein [Clostridia bacterium]
MSRIELKNISKKYGEKTVLDNFSCEIENNEKIAIMGPSGSGKTTLLRIISGLEKSDGGEIKGVPQKLSFVFQENRLCEDFTPIANIRYISGNAFNKQEISDCLFELGFQEESLEKAVKTMSGGMKRRVAIARAILADFDMLIMDEPFDGLDEELKLSVMKYIKNKVKDKTLVFVTHDPEEAQFLADRIIEIQN